MPDLGSVLVIRLSSLGDVLFAVPAVQALLASGRAERVSWLVEDRAASLLGMVAGLSETVVFPRRRPGRWLAHAAALRHRRDDVVVDFQCNLKSRVHLAVLRAPRKLGFDVPLAREGAQRALTEVVLPPHDARHRVASNFALVGALGVATAPVLARPDLVVGDREMAEAREFLSMAAGDGPAVVLHPGTSAFGQLKRWDVARFAALGERLARDAGARVIVTAGPGEEPIADAVCARLTIRGRRAPAGPIPHLAALLAAADVLVAADSLPLHLANALGTPVVGLYGAKDRAITGPCWDRSIVVAAGVDCSPCTLRRCRDRICMERLDVEPVYAAVQQLLASARQLHAEHPA